MRLRFITNSQRNDRINYESNVNELSRSKDNKSQGPINIKVLNRTLKKIKQRKNMPRFNVNFTRFLLDLLIVAHTVQFKLIIFHSHHCRKNTIRSVEF